MNLVFKVIMMSFMLNISVGLMINLFPTQFGAGYEYNRGNANYNESYMASFETGMQDIVNPNGVVEDEANSVYKVLDMLTLGYVSKFLTLIKQYLYGFVMFMELLFGRFLTTSVFNLLFNHVYGFFYVMTHLGYILGAFWLWTGKNIMENG